MKKLIYAVIFLALLQGCADTITDNDPANSDLTIEIKKPLDNDSIGYKGNVIQYELKEAGEPIFIELYVDNKFIRNYPPVNNQIPVINFEIDSSLTGKRIELYLIYYSQNGNSYKSNTVKNVLVTEDKTLPSAPVNLKIILLSNTSLNLSWEDNSAYILEYEIWRREGTDTNFIKHLSVPAADRNVNDENLLQGTVYYYKVRGISRNGISDFSTIIDSKGSGGSSEVPAPGNLTASVADMQKINLSWSDNSTNENYFKIERRRPWALFETVGHAPANAVSFTDSTSGLIAGADYFYRVKAVSAKDSSWSNEAYVTMPFYILKPPAIISIVNVSSRRVTINWKDNDERWADFVVERKENGGTYSERARLTGSINTFQDSVQPGKNYSYRIKENDGIYSSEYSDEVQITTQVIPLPAPDISGYFDGNAMIISWQYNSDAEIFKLERRDSTGQGSYTEIAVIKGNEREYADYNTLCQHTYVYRLKASDTYVDSPYSPEKIIKNWKNCP